MMTGYFASPAARNEEMMTMFNVRPVSSKILSSKTDAPISMIVSVIRKQPH